MKCEICGSNCWGKICPACKQKQSDPIKSDNTCSWDNKGLKCSNEWSIKLESRTFCSYHAFCYENNLSDSDDSTRQYRKTCKTTALKTLSNDGLFSPSLFTGEDIASMKRGVNFLLYQNPGLASFPSFKSFYTKLMNFDEKDIF